MSTDTQAQAPADTRLDHELYLGLYRRMRLIRGVEELIQSLFLRNEVYGTTHLYSGQAAVPVVAGTWKAEFKPFGLAMVP